MVVSAYSVSRVNRVSILIAILLAILLSLIRILVITEEIIITKAITRVLGKWISIAISSSERILEEIPIRVDVLGVDHGITAREVTHVNLVNVKECQ